MRCVLYFRQNVSVVYIFREIFQVLPKAISSLFKQAMLRRSSYLIQSQKTFFIFRHVKYSSAIKVPSENHIPSEKQNIVNKVVAITNELIGFDEIDKLYKAVSSLQVNII